MIIKKINDNAYQLKLPSHLRIFDLFNVKHLIPYAGDSLDKEISKLRMSSFQSGEDDADVLADPYLDSRDRI